MKAVMLSIRPKWCNKIASGEKVIEIEVEEVMKIWKEENKKCGWKKR